MSGLGKALVVIGGVAATVGALWWWLTRYENGLIICENYKTENECVGAGCYWYNGGCHEYPEHDLKYHFECIKDPMTNLILCTLLEGVGVDQCDPYASPELCWDKVSCDTDSNCGAGAKCWENKCHWTANEHLDWEGEQLYSVVFEFDKRVIGNKLMGDVGFMLAPWNVACAPYLAIHLIRNGKRVKTIYNKEHEGMAGTWGEPYVRTDTLSVFTSPEAVDGIEFECYCLRGFPWYSRSAVLSKVHCQYMYI